MKKNKIKDKGLNKIKLLSFYFNVLKNFEMQKENKNSNRACCY